MNARLSICLAAALFTAPGFASTLDALVDDPEAARAFDYCAWRFAQDEPPSGIPDFESVLANENEQATEGRLRAAALADAGTKIALASESSKTCAKTFAAGLKSYTRSHDQALKALRSSRVSASSADPAIAEVQSTITDLWAEDQAARQVYIRSRTADEVGAPFWASRLAYDLATAVDAESTRHMKELLLSYDWIDSERFGGKIASHAWILVQHADDHPEFQQLALSRMEPYLESGGVKKSDYAHLWDRVAVNHGRKQRYGTQPDWQCQDGKLTLRPLEDPDNVDVRRAEMDMGPVQEQLDEMSRATCGD
jgi:hypothetical protein